MPSEKVCFVTVGTTSFDALIQMFSSKEVHDSLAYLGITRIELQIGKGSFEVENAPGLLPMNSFRFSPSLDQYMRNASLVISHAGAGSIMEALSFKKPLLVVINETLMDNHQFELSDILHEQGYLTSTTCSQLEATINSFSLNITKAYPAQNHDAFPALVDNTLGF
jgi:beta-1,4-N-acetylglucosaminyltransferase